MGACGKVDQVLDLRSKGLGFDSIHAGNVKKSSKLIPSCVCPKAVLGTLWSETCWVVLSSNNTASSRTGHEFGPTRHSGTRS